MDLITVAHLGEAQNIIEEWNLTRVSPDFYQGAELACLITGEGPFESGIRTSRVLGSLPIKRIINLGICGTLAELPLQSIHPIRTIYLVIEGRPQFKSFPVMKEGKDLITSFERILSPEKAKVLSGVGDLVDREAWGVALAAKESQIPFECYKLISDRAGTLDSCELVREKAEEFSVLLCQFLKRHLKTAILSPEDVLFEDKDFHFTFTTRKAFEALAKRLQRLKNAPLDGILLRLGLAAIREEKRSPKERTRELLNRMETELDPFRGRLTEELLAWKKPLEGEGIHLQTDPTWESGAIKIQFEVVHAGDLDLKVKALEKIDWTVWSKLRQGDVRVE